MSSVGKGIFFERKGEYKVLDPYCLVQCACHGIDHLSEPSLLARVNGFVVSMIGAVVVVGSDCGIVVSRPRAPSIVGFAPSIGCLVGGVGRGRCTIGETELAEEAHDDAEDNQQADRVHPEGEEENCDDQCEGVHGGE